MAGLALLATVWLGAVGCQSFGTAPGDLASVTITNRPLAEVQAAVTKVFAAHVFAGGSTGPDQFTFHRIGTGTDQVAYGSHLFQRPITVKVVVTTRTQSPEVVVVGCNAWVIEAENDPTFQEIHPVRTLGKRPYEDMLKEIQSQLSQ